MPGIQRIKIISENNGRGSWRFKVANRFVLCRLNQIYQMVFNLLPDIETIECQAEDKLTRYDKEFGVDVILTHVEGQQSTVQEKCLTTNYSTVTIEYYQNHRAQTPGDWFNLKCDYYLVAYVVGPLIRRYILLDWNAVKRISHLIPWQLNINKQDGARASFRYAEFNQIPSECILSIGTSEDIKEWPPIY